MYSFQALDDVQSTLQRLIEREFVAALPRQPGTKETRYSHLFSGEVEKWDPPRLETQSSADDPDRLSRLEAEVAVLRREVSELKDQLAGLKGQFE
jgi:uncharacterized protein YceH (UPF0502 family)